MHKPYFFSQLHKEAFGRFGVSNKFRREVDTTINGSPFLLRRRFFLSDD